MTTANDKLVVVIQGPSGWLALTADELRKARDRASALGFDMPSPVRPPVAREGMALLDSRQLGKALGVSSAWCEQAAKQDRIPSVRCGRYLRFDPQAVRAALAARS